MEQEIFVHAYEVVRPIVLKASRQYFIQLWDQADMEQEAMMTLYQLLEKFPELKSDDDKLRRYFKTKFRNRLNDEVRRQESVKRQANRQCYIEISDIAFCHLEHSLNRSCFSQGKHLIYTIIKFGKKCYLGKHTYILYLKKILRLS